MQAHPNTALSYPLSYFSDSARLMTTLATLEMPVFFDSSSHADGSARYDLLSAAPTAYLKIERGQPSCSDPDIEIDSLNLFKAIRQLQQKYLPLSELAEDIGHAQPLGMGGGIMGYLGYPRLRGKDDLEIQDAFVGVYHWAVIVDHHAQTTALVLHGACPEALKCKLLDLLLDGSPVDAGPYPDDFMLRSNFIKQLSRERYTQAFKRIKGYIDAGDCYQVNLTQQFKAECSGSPLAAYLKLRRSSPAPFSAYLNWGSGALLSLSPERFLKVVGNSVITQPIKGTRPRDVNRNKDAQLARELLSSEKDRAENLMIVDLLRNDLGQVCRTGSIKADQLFELQSFSNVHHMVSTISGELAAQKDALDLLESCFPGGSITGAPKLRAMEIIQELEPLPRQAYCGAVFYLGANGDMDSNITIRSLLWQPGSLLCGAGGAIVADSDCDAEYEECFHKISSIINSLKS